MRRLKRRLLSFVVGVLLIVDTVALAAVVTPVAANSETAVWLAVIAAIAGLTSTIVAALIVWKTQGRQHAWTKEEAETVATSLAAKVKEDAERLEENRRTEATAIEGRAREEQLKVSTKLIERAEGVAIKVDEATRLLTQRFEDIQTQAKAAFEVGNHSRQDLTALTAELVALRKEVAWVKDEMNGANVPPTLEILKKQLEDIGKALKGRGRKR